MNIGSVFFKAGLDDSRLGIDAKKSGEKAGTAAATGFRSRLSGAFRGGIGVGLGIGAFNILANSIGSVTSALAEARDAYMTDLRSQAQLRTSLEANVDAYDGNADAIERVLQERIKLGFSDDEQRESLRNLVAITRDVDKALEIQRTAMDLARMRGMSLADATTLLGKVAGGNVGILKRYGIAIDKGATSTEALAAIQRIASGQAETYADTLEGRVEVAAVRSAEAQERLGEATAEFSADLEETKAGAIENFVTGLDYFADGLNFSNQSLERQIELLTVEANVMGGAKRAQAEMLLETLKAEQAFRDQYEVVEDLRGAVDLHADASLDGADATDDLTDSLEEQEDQAEDTQRAIEDLASAIADELFGDAINAGNEARLKRQIRDLRDQRSEVRQNSPKWRELTGEIAENEQQLFELQLKMKEREGPRAVISWLQQQKRKFGDTTGSIQRLIDHYRTLIGLQSRLAGAPLAGGIAWTGTAPRAQGGPVMQGSAYVVGEEGPELFVPTQSGYIVPNPGTTSGMAGSPSATNSWASSMSVTIQNIDARGATNPQAVGSAVKQGIADAMADVLQAQTARLPVGTKA